MAAEEPYLVKDLAGCEVYTTESEYLGKLTDVLPTGGNDIFVVKNEEKEILIPALKSVILSVDLEKRRIEVQLLEGLQDLQP